MHAHVGREDRVFRYHAREAFHQTLGTQRDWSLSANEPGICPRRTAVRASAPPSPRKSWQISASPVRAGSSPRGSRGCRRRCRGDGVIASDSAGSCRSGSAWWAYGQRVAADPRAGGAVVEAAAEREHDIGVARGSLAAYGPFRPIAPNASSWVSSMVPLPLGLVTR